MTTSVNGVILVLARNFILSDQAMLSRGTMESRSIRSK